MINNAAPDRFLTGTISTYTQAAIDRGAFSKVYSGTFATAAVAIERNRDGAPGDRWVGVFLSTGELPWILADCSDIDRSIYPWVAATSTNQYVGLPVTFQIWDDGAGGRFAFNVNSA